MKPWPTVRLGEVLTPIERPEAPVAGTTYRQLGVSLWGNGAYERGSIDGAATKYSTLSRVEADDIVVNKIWARNGSVAVVQPQLGGCFVSGEFPTFMANLGKLDPRWIHWLTKTPSFWAQCDEKSQGTSGKNRIKPEQFLNVEIPLPPLAEQRRVVARIEELAAQTHEARTLRHQSAEEAEALSRSGAEAAFQKARTKLGTKILGYVCNTITEVITIRRTSVMRARVSSLSEMFRAVGCILRTRNVLAWIISEA